MTIPQIGADRIGSLGCKCDVGIAIAVDIGNREVVENSGQWELTGGLPVSRMTIASLSGPATARSGRPITIEISGLRDLRDRRYHRRVSYR